MKQTYDQVMLGLRKQQYMPIYFLYGEESYFIDQASDFIEHYVLDESERAFDQQIFYGKDFQDVAPIVSMAQRFPMMSPYQVIIVKEAQQIKKWDALGLYAQHPSPQTILVFCHKYGNPDARKSIFKELGSSQQCAFMEAKKLTDYQATSWIREYIQNWNSAASHTQQVSIDERVVGLLIAAHGGDLTRITTDLQKLINGRPEGCQVIDAALVERNIGISKDYNVFELESALIAGDVVKTNRIVRYFATSGSKQDHSIIKELSVLYTFFSNLFIYEYLPSTNPQEAAATLKVPPFLIKDYATAARRFPAGKTLRIIGKIRETDARAKGINNPSAGELDLWQELIYFILH